MSSAQPYNTGCYGNLELVFGLESGSTIKMVTRRLTAGNIVVAVFDSDFGIFDGD